MYNGKYVTTDFIIEKIQEKYAFTNGMDRFSIADKIFDAMELIGTPLAYIKRQTDGEGDNPDVIEIEDYSASLPCDMFKIEGVREYTTNRVIYRDTSLYPGDVAEENDKLVYHINDSNIFVNFEEGQIVITYLAFPTSSDGTPLIPDDTRYINGVVAVVAHAIAEPMWFRKELDSERFNYLVQERAWGIPSARNSMNMPDYDRAESIKNMMNRMFKAGNDYKHGFKFLNSEERLKTHK